MNIKEGLGVVLLLVLLLEDWAQCQRTSTQAGRRRIPYLRYRDGRSSRREFGVPGRAVTGSYKWTTSDGKEVITHYKADAQGYRAVTVTPKPTDSPSIAADEYQPVGDLVNTPPTTISTPSPDLRIRLALDKRDKTTTRPLTQKLLRSALRRASRRNYLRVVKPQRTPKPSSFDEQVRAFQQQLPIAVQRKFTSSASQFPTADTRRSSDLTAPPQYEPRVTDSRTDLEVPITQPLANQKKPSISYPYKKDHITPTTYTPKIPFSKLIQSMNNKPGIVPTIPPQKASVVDFDKLFSDTYNEFLQHTQEVGQPQISISHPLAKEFTPSSLQTDGASTQKIVRQQQQTFQDLSEGPFESNIPVPLSSNANILKKGSERFDKFKASTHLQSDTIIKPSIEPQIPEKQGSESQHVVSVVEKQALGKKQKDTITDFKTSPHVRHQAPNIVRSKHYHFQRHGYRTSSSPYTSNLSQSHTTSPITARTPQLDTVNLKKISQNRVDRYRPEFYAARRAQLQNQKRNRYHSHRFTTTSQRPAIRTTKGPSYTRIVTLPPSLRNRKTYIPRLPVPQASPRQYLRRQRPRPSLELSRYHVTSQPQSETSTLLSSSAQFSHIEPSSTPYISSDDHFTSQDTAAGVTENSFSRTDEYIPSHATTEEEQKDIEQSSKGTLVPLANFVQESDIISTTPAKENAISESLHISDESPLPTTMHTSEFAGITTETSIQAEDYFPTEIHLQDERLHQAKPANLTSTTSSSQEAIAVELKTEEASKSGATASGALDQFTSDLKSDTTATGALNQFTSDRKSDTTATGALDQFTSDRKSDTTATGALDQFTSDRKSDATATGALDQFTSDLKSDKIATGALDQFISDLKSDTTATGEFDQSIIHLKSDTTATDTLDQSISHLKSDTTATGSSDQSISHLSDDATVTAMLDQSISHLKSDTIATDVLDHSISDLKSDTTATGALDQSISDLKSDTTTSDVLDQSISDLKSDTTATDALDQSISDLKSDTIVTGALNQSISDLKSDAIATGALDQSISDLNNDTFDTYYQYSADYAALNNNSDYAYNYDYDYGGLYDYNLQYANDDYDLPFNNKLNSSSSDMSLSNLHVIKLNNKTNSRFPDFSYKNDTQEKLSQPSQQVQVFVKPSQLELIQPLESENSKASDTELSKPLEIELGQPSDIELVQPSEIKVIQASQTELAQPSETELAQPSETKLTQALEIELAQPSESEFSHTSETELPQPSQQIKLLVKPLEAEVSQPLKLEVFQPTETELSLDKLKLSHGISKVDSETTILSSKNETVKTLGETISNVYLDPQVPTINADLKNKNNKGKLTEDILSSNLHDISLSNSGNILNNVDTLVVEDTSDKLGIHTLGEYPRYGATFNIYGKSVDPFLYRYAPNEKDVSLDLELEKNKNIIPALNEEDILLSQPVEKTHEILLLEEAPTDVSSNQHIDEAISQKIHELAQTHLPNTDTFDPQTAEIAAPTPQLSSTQESYKTAEVADKVSVTEATANKEKSSSGSSDSLISADYDYVSIPGSDPYLNFKAQEGSVETPEPSLYLKQTIHSIPSYILEETLGAHQTYSGSTDLLKTKTPERIYNDTKSFRTISQVGETAQNHTGIKHISQHLYSDYNVSADEPQNTHFSDYDIVAEPQEGHYKTTVDDSIISNETALDYKSVTNDYIDTPVETAIFSEAETDGTFSADPFHGTHSNASIDVTTEIVTPLEQIVSVEPVYLRNRTLPAEPLLKAQTGYLTETLYTETPVISSESAATAKPSVTDATHASQYRDIDTYDRYADQYPQGSLMYNSSILKQFAPQSRQALYIKLANAENTPKTFTQETSLKPAQYSPYYNYNFAYDFSKLFQTALNDSHSKIGVSSLDYQDRKPDTIKAGNQENQSFDYLSDYNVATTNESNLFQTYNNSPISSDILSYDYADYDYSHYFDSPPQEGPLASDKSENITMKLDKTDKLPPIVASGTVAGTNPGYIPKEKEIFTITDAYTASVSPKAEPRQPIEAIASTGSGNMSAISHEFSQIDNSKIDSDVTVQDYSEHFVRVNQDHSTAHDLKSENTVRTGQQTEKANAQSSVMVTAIKSDQGLDQDQSISALGLPEQVQASDSSILTYDDASIQKAEAASSNKKLEIIGEQSKSLKETTHLSPTTYIKHPEAYYFSTDSSKTGLPEATAQKNLYESANYGGSFGASSTGTVYKASSVISPPFDSEVQADTSHGSGIISIVPFKPNATPKIPEKSDDVGTKSDIYISPKTDYAYDIPPHDFISSSHIGTGSDTSSLYSDYISSLGHDGSTDSLGTTADKSVTVTTVKQVPSSDSNDAFVSSTVANQVSSVQTTGQGKELEEAYSSVTENEASSAKTKSLSFYQSPIKEYSDSNATDIPVLLEFSLATIGENQRATSHSPTLKGTFLEPLSPDTLKSLFSQKRIFPLVLRLARSSRLKDYQQQK